MGLDLFSVTQAAHTLKLTPARVRRFIAEKRLKADEIGGRYVIARRELDRFKVIPRSPGKPPAKKSPRRK